MEQRPSPSDTRPDIDTYFLSIARQVSTRATCPRASVGAVIVRDRRILTTGYNGSPPGIRHCTQLGCLMADGHCLRTTHAEANAIVQAAHHGVSLDRATIYCTHSPCLGCTKLLITAGIKHVVYLTEYTDINAWKMLTEAGVTSRVYRGTVSDMHANRQT